MLDRGHKIPITNEEKTKQLKIIKTTAENNGYNMNDIKKSYDKQIRNRNKENNIVDRDKSWQNSYASVKKLEY
jgi:hypothetical protein